MRIIIAAFTFHVHYLSLYYIFINYAHKIIINMYSLEYRFLFLMLRSQDYSADK
jgi:hypothetical protein